MTPTISSSTRSTGLLITNAEIFSSTNISTNVTTLDKSITIIADSGLINAVFGGENTHTVLDYTIGNRHDRFDQFARLRKGVVIDNVFNERAYSRYHRRLQCECLPGLHKDRAGGQPTVSIFTNIENTISSERFYEFLKFHCLYPPYFTSCGTVQISSDICRADRQLRELSCRWSRSPSGTQTKCR